MSKLVSSFRNRRNLGKTHFRTYSFFKKWATYGLFFFYFRLFLQTFNSYCGQYKLQMAGFKHGFSGIGRDRSANCATTAAQLITVLPNCRWNLNYLQINSRGLEFCQKATTTTAIAKSIVKSINQANCIPLEAPVLLHTLVEELEVVVVYCTSKMQLTFLGARRLTEKVALEARYCSVFK